MANYTIRQATDADIDDLLTLRQIMFDAMGVDGDDTWRPGAASYLRDGFTSGDVAAFVGDAGGKVVGGGVGMIYRRLPGPGNPAGLFGYIKSMVTVPAWRGCGIGGGVVDALLTWFAAKDVPIVDLHATTEGESLYRSRGFTDVRYAALRRR